MALAPDRRRAAWFGGVDGSRWMIDLADPRVPKLVWRLERIEPREWVGMWVPPDWQSDAPAVVETGRAMLHVAEHGVMERMGDESKRILAQWRESSDPIAGLRQAIDYFADPAADPR